MKSRLWEIQYAGSPKILWSEKKPTEDQLKTAAGLNVQVSRDDTYAGLAAKILEAVGDAIGCPPRVVSARQHELALELGIDLNNCGSWWAAYVRIQEEIQVANLAAVKRMELKPGDIVVQADSASLERLQEALGERWESVAGHFPREFEVSSIRQDGQVYFKGGSGQAPARYLEKVERP